MAPRLGWWAAVLFGGAVFFNGGGLGGLTGPDAGAADVAGIPYADVFNATEAKGIDPRLVAAVAHHETGGFSEAVIACRQDSPAGPKGIMQFMPATATEYGIDPCDPHQAIPAAADYLLTAYEQFGSWELALAAYNAGPGAVQDAGNAVPVNGETESYVPKIMGLWQGYQEEFPGGSVTDTDPGSGTASDTEAESSFDWTPDDPTKN